MSQQFNELEQQIGYQFHNRDHLRRALTCESAINERHPDASIQNFQVLEFVGDAALKYAIATLLYMKQRGSGSVAELNNRVFPLIANSKLSRIGRELNLSKYIIKGNGVSDVTENMLADAVEAILGAIVIDQQEQGNVSEKVLFDVVSRLWYIKIDKPSAPSSLPTNNNNNKKKCSCCKYFCVIVLCLILFAGLLFFVATQADL